MDRRHFLKVLSGVVLTAGTDVDPLASLNRGAAKTEMLVTPYAPDENPTHDFVSLVTLNDLQLHMIPCLKMDAHGIAQHPRQKNKIAVFSHHGPKSILVDVETKVVLQEFDSVKGYWFYGHGSYSRDGKLLYSAEYDLSESAGLIAIRDAQTLKVIGRFPSHGILPHEIYLMPDEKTAVIANQGYKPNTQSRFLKASLTYVDIASGKLLHKIETSENDINFGHLAVNSRGQVAGGADHKIAIKGTSSKDLRNFIFQPAPVYFGEIGKTTQVNFPQDPAVKKNCLSSLSLCINDFTDEVAVTYPEGGIVNFWSMKDFSYRGSLDLKGQRPLGVSVTDNGKNFAVNTTDSTLHFIDSRNYKITKTVGFAKPGGPARYCQGAHLIHISV